MPFTLPNRPAKTDLAVPTCGQCGYCVRGIPELSCPECGSDLREVGIVPPNKRALNSKAIKLILWTFAAPPLAALLSCLLFVTVLPFGQTCKFNRDITFQSSYFNATFSIWGREHPWQPRVMGIPPLSPQNVNIYDAQRLGDLTLQPRTGNFNYFKYSTGNQSNGTNLTSKDLAKCFAPPGTNLADPHVQDVFNALYSTIIQTSKNIGTNNLVPMLDSTGNKIGVAHTVSYWVVYDEPNPTLIVVLAIFWLIIWIYGFRRILT